MDIVSVTGSSIAVIISFTRRYVTIIGQLVEPNETRLLSLQAKLFSENARFAQWIDYMGVKEWEDLEKILRPEDKPTVNTLWSNFNLLLSQAKEQMGRIDLRKGKIANRMRWAIGGEYEKLKELLEAIRDINFALYSVAQPPSMYTPSPEPGLILGPGPRVGETLRVQQRLTSIENTGTDEHAETSSIQESETPTVQRWISLLFRQAVTIMESLVEYAKPTSPYEKRTTPFISCFVRLQNWPGTFLDGDLALDLLLNKKEKGVMVYASLKTALIITFVDIILLEEVLLNHLIKHAKADHLERNLISISSTFFSEEETLKIATSRSAGIAADDPQTTRLFFEAAELLGHALDDLYDLLPLIRNLRHGHLLDLESTAVRATTVEEEVPNETLTMREIVEDIDNILDSAQETIEESVARMMRKERERLADSEEYFTDVKIGKAKQDKVDAIISGFRRWQEKSAQVMVGGDAESMSQVMNRIKDPDKVREYLEDTRRRVAQVNDELSGLRADPSSA